MKLTISNKNQEIEVTEDLSDAYLDKGHVFLDPDVKDNGILKALKKYRMSALLLTSVQQHMVLNSFLSPSEIVQFTTLS